MTQKLESLQVSYVNATAVKRILEANLTELQQEQMKSCAPGWEYFKRKCYYFSTDVMNWTDSRDACVTMGGHLLILNSEAEMDFARDNGAGFWIGLSDLDEEGTFRWVDGTLLTNSYLTWSPGQPNNWKNQDCAVFLESDSFLGDDSCDKLHFRICESNCDV
ncbi:C-type lectin domain family 4 member E-like [Engraulis encrasicolus]|uniref:C-type lectin domain family 4 member E-like n=1 Tax=Engraulis encrasicolus TaxID=184585 RepID=UPI002FD3C14E